MKKAFFYIIIYTAALFPLSLKADKTLPCASGGICVAVQENADGTTKVSFNDFVHIDDIDGYYMRIIEENEGSTGETQIQNAVDMIAEQDPALGEEFRVAVGDVKKADSRKMVNGKSKSKTGSWVRKTLAFFNPARKKFVVDPDLYAKLKASSATDTAGVVINMACQKVAMGKNIPSYQFVNCERLARRLFCDEKCYEAVAEYTKSPVPTVDQRKAKIKYLLGMFVPPPNSGDPANSSVNQNLASGNGGSNVQMPSSPRQTVQQQARVNPSAAAPVINNMPPIPATPAGANPWVAPQYQQQQSPSDTQSVAAPVPGSDMTAVQQQSAADGQVQQQPQQSAEVQVPAVPEGQVQQQQQQPAPGT